MKLQDPEVFSNGKSGDLVEYWLAKMRGKMAANDNLYNTLERRIVYVMNRISGDAFGHLEPRARANMAKP